MGSLKKTGAWWVLAVGNSFRESGFEGRDLCRAMLLRQVGDAGISLDENVWVYDDNECAQLVIASCENEQEAQKAMERFAGTGLKLKMTKEFE